MSQTSGNDKAHLEEVPSLDALELDVVDLEVLAEGDEALAAFLGTVRATLGAPPAPLTSERHLAAIAEAARAASVPTLAARRRSRIVLVLAAAFMVVGGTLASLSYAGVITLPRPMQAVFPTHRAPASQPAREPGTSVKVPDGTSDSVDPVAPQPASNQDVGQVQMPGDGTLKAGSDSSDGSTGGGDSSDHPAQPTCQPLAGSVEPCVPDSP